MGARSVEAPPSTHRHGVRTFILTHKQDATDNLFGITERFHQNTCLS